MFGCRTTSYPAAWTAIIACFALSEIALAQSLAESSSLLSNQTPASDNDSMMSYLMNRVRQDPEHSESWRMLGRLHAESGDPESASEAFHRALESDPNNAAAHFDVGRFRQQDYPALARLHFQKVLVLAPDSDYARMVRDLHIDGLEDSVDGEQIASQQVTLPAIGVDEIAAIDPELAPDEATAFRWDTETSASTYDMNFWLDPVTTDNSSTEKRLTAFLETGVLYNSNLSLTPISRNFASEGVASAQWVINPDLQYQVANIGSWRSGLLGRGYFSVNETLWNEFDLASFQPGIYFERDLSPFGDQIRIARLEYQYAVDLFGGNRIGDRHQITGSISRLLTDGDFVHAYVSLADTNFVDDGTQPVITSLDGPTYTAGVSRHFVSPFDWLQSRSVGLSVEHANTFGADFRYWSLRIHADATIRMNERWSFIPAASLGLRHYPDFTGAIERDELVWRLSTQLRRRLNERTSMSIVVHYDRFGSDHPDFDIDRLMGGVMTTVRY